MSEALTSHKVWSLAPLEGTLVTFESHTGGREALVATLLHIPLPADAKMLLGLLASEITTPLASLLDQCRLTPSDLYRLYKAAKEAEGHLLSAITIHNGAPAVVEDVMAKSIPYESACSVCGGVGSVTPEPSKWRPNPSPEPCKACGEKGVQTYQPDHEVQRTALELAGLLKSGGGLSLTMQQMNVNQAGSADPGALEQLQEAAAQILYGGAPPVVDAEYVESSPVEPVPPSPPSLETPPVHG